MAISHKTPGVYIQELAAFPSLIVGADTAVPCFIGYTERAVGADDRDLTLVPTRVDSLDFFESCFGGAARRLYYLTTDEVTAPDRRLSEVTLDGTNRYTLVETGSRGFCLYESMRLFYANGGGAAYVISCGGYGDDPAASGPSLSDLEAAIDICGTFAGPTMVAIPDAVSLATESDFGALCRKLLRSCAAAGDRMALLDICGADRLAAGDDWSQRITDFRASIDAVDPSARQFGAAYFPALATDVVSPSEIDLTHFDMSGAHRETLQSAFLALLRKKYAAAPGQSDDETGLTPSGRQIYADYVLPIGDFQEDDAPPQGEAPEQLPRRTPAETTRALSVIAPEFRELLATIARHRGILPASPAIAGVWSANDATVGVWHAPANIALDVVRAPVVAISTTQQEALNVPLDGLAVNAIRSFSGRGTVVWGARTLDGNSLDWRYIPTKRLAIYIEQSVQSALPGLAREPNNAQTWAIAKAMIETFLSVLWQQGGLMGAKPQDAFSVSVGLGSTMTGQDILDGMMHVQIAAALMHPAEFVSFTFSQQMSSGG